RTSAPSPAGTASRWAKPCDSWPSVATRLAGSTEPAARLEVETIRQGPPGSRQTFYWQPPTSCPRCSRPFGPDETPASAPWGGDRATIGDYWHEQSPPSS